MLKKRTSALDPPGKPAIITKIAWPAPQPVAGLFFGPTLGQSLSNSSKPSLQFLRNWFTNSKRLVRSLKSVVAAWIRENFVKDEIVLDPSGKSGL